MATNRWAGHFAAQVWFSALLNRRLNIGIQIQFLQAGAFFCSFLFARILYLVHIPYVQVITVSDHYIGYIIV
jgi:hypothetical protein